jgi:glutathione S-transferase
MEFVAIVAALALLEYGYFGIQVSRARVRYGIKPPATSGHEIFERHYRVHQNTLEQLVVFLPALFLFASYVSAPLAAALGVVFLVGRLVYERGYVADPEKRGTGFVIGLVAHQLLLLGGLAGAAWSLLR